MNPVEHFARVLEMDLAANESLGWREVARSWIPSCFQFQILLQWKGAGEPAPVVTSL